MKIRSIGFGLVLFLGLARFGNCTEVEFVISGVQNTNGLLLLGGFAEASDFLKQGKIRHGAAPVIPVTVIKLSIPEGKYAFSVFHDENKNQKLDVNKVGIPIEAYAFSGAYDPAKGRAPTFDDTKIEIKGAKQRIELSF